MSEPSFYCPQCERFDGPTTRYVRVQSDDMHDRGIVHETALEFYCGRCGELTEEVTACSECKAALPESGADQCSACLAVIEGAAIGGTGRFLRIMADMSQDETRVTRSPAPDPMEAVQSVTFGPMSRVRDIAAFCERYSDATHEVVAHIYCLNGKPVISPRRVPRLEGLESILRPGSEAPLMLKRQAN